MKVNYNYLFDQFSNPEPIFAEMREWVKTGEFTLGPWVDKFEKKFAKYIGVKHCISVNTGTDALILCLKSLGIGEGHEVITVANTFYATAGAIVATGAKPVFVDCDDRYQIDATEIEKKINSRTRAILPVHWAGCSPDMESIDKVAQAAGLPVVEDACPAVGAKVGERFAGSFGKVNAFSMHPLKPLNVWGDGGMVVTNDDHIHDWLLKYRNHGMTDRDHIAIWGINARLQPFQAIVGSHCLDAIEENISRRIHNAEYLDRKLENLHPYVRLPQRPQHHREVYQLYIARVRRRDALVRFLNDQEVEAKVHYPIPLHLQPPARLLGYREGDCPHAEAQAGEIITLPAHQALTKKQLDFMVEKITEFYKTM